MLPSMLAFVLLQLTTVPTDLPKLRMNGSPEHNVIGTDNHNNGLGLTVTLTCAVVVQPLFVPVTVNVTVCGTESELLNATVKLPAAEPDAGPDIFISELSLLHS